MRENWDVLALGAALLVAIFAAGLGWLWVTLGGLAASQLVIWASLRAGPEHERPGQRDSPLFD